MSEAVGVEVPRRSTLRMLLGPRWLAVHALVAALVVVMVNLALWQLDRLDQRRDFNDRVRANAALAAIDGSSADWDALATAPVADIEWRRIELSGTYLASEQVTIVNRSQGGVAGYDVVTPLRLAGGGLVLVDRGFLAQGTPVPSPPSGVVELIGRLRRAQERAFGQLSDAGEGRLTELFRVDVARIAEQLPEPLVIETAYVDRLEGGGEQAAAPAPVADPELSEGPHLSYAVQWCIFSLCAVGAWVALVRRAVRAARRPAAPAAAADSTATDHVDWPAY